MYTGNNAHNMKNITNGPKRAFSFIFFASLNGKCASQLANEGSTLKLQVEKFLETVRAA